MKRIKYENVNAAAAENYRGSEEGNENDLDQACRTSIEEIVSIQLIAIEIFKNMSVEELLQCSLINRSWNTYVRSFLRDNKECLIQIKGPNPCKQLKAINNLLYRSFQHLPPPFNGLSISSTWKSRFHNCLNVDSKTPKVSKLYSGLFEHVPMKYFHFNWDQPLTCPTAKLIEEILTDAVTSAALIGLTITKYPFTEAMPSGRVSFKNKWKRKLSWPNLKYLTLPSDLEDCIHPFSVNELLEASPKLEVLSGRTLSSYIEAILKHHKAHTVQDFVYKIDHHNNTPESRSQAVEDLNKFASKEPKNIRCLSISTIEFPRNPFNHEKFLQLKSSLQLFLSKSNSFSTLNKLEITHLDLLMLPSLSVFSSEAFTGLKSLLLKYDSVMDDRFEISTLSRINLTELFPNLQNVDIDLESQTDTTNLAVELEQEWEDADLEYDDLYNYYISDHFRISTQQYTCVSVTQLTFSKLPPAGEGLEGIDVALHRLGRVFPNVKDLIFDCEIVYQDMFLKLCSTLWSDAPIWPQLEVIKFNAVQGRVVVLDTRSCVLSEVNIGHNYMDPCFTGLTFEQLREIKKLNNYDFQNVATRAADKARTGIRHLTKLKLLRLQIKHEMRRCNEPINPNFAFISEITGNLAFSRMPDLTVEIQRVPCKHFGDQSHKSCCFQLDYLKHFVKILD